MGLLSSIDFKPSSVCEVGCGAGYILAEMRKSFPAAELLGYDIAPDAAQFWTHHEWAGISFKVGDFFELNNRSFDLVLLMDMIEHLENPFAFLRRLREYGRLFIFHIPLDLSAMNIIRQRPLLRSWSRVGHLHYFTKDLALALLKECRYQVLDCRYTGAAFSSPKRNWKTRLAALPRRLAYTVNKEMGVRIFGGETLIILAQAGNESGH